MSSSTAEQTLGLLQVLNELVKDQQASLARKQFSAIREWLDGSYSSRAYCSDEQLETIVRRLPANERPILADSDNCETVADAYGRRPDSMNKQEFLDFVQQIASGKVKSSEFSEYGTVFDCLAGSQFTDSERLGFLVTLLDRLFRECVRGTPNSHMADDIESVIDRIGETKKAESVTILLDLVNELIEGELYANCIGDDASVPELTYTIERACEALLSLFRYRASWGISNLKLFRMWDEHLGSELVNVHIEVRQAIWSLIPYHPGTAES